MSAKSPQCDITVTGPLSNGTASLCVDAGTHIMQGISFMQGMLELNRRASWEFEWHPQLGRVDSGLPDSLCTASLPGDEVYVKVSTADK